MAVTTEDLSTWLVERAGVSPKFLGAVLATCDEQMIGTVDNLAMLQSGGQLGSVFKPVIAASIESALSGGGAPAPAVSAVGAVSAASAPANGASAPALSLQDVKRQLMVNRQSTWGNEAELRTNLDMFLKQENAKLGSWDSASQTWANAFVQVGGAVATVAPAAAPAAAPTAAPAAAPVAAAAPPPQAAVPPPAAAAPAVAAPPAPAAPAGAARPLDSQASHGPTIVCDRELGVGRWGAYPDVDLDLDSITLTQAQTQTLRTLRTLRALRTLRTLRTLPSASAADPNKSTFTVTLKTPDGDIVFECPPDQYVLDEAEEQEIEGADGLPYACRAGSCSACTGKVAATRPPTNPPFLLAGLPPLLPCLHPPHPPPPPAAPAPRCPP